MGKFRRLLLYGNEGRASGASDDGSSASSAAPGEVMAACCTRDGTHVVTGHTDGAVQLWDSRTGEPDGDALRGQRLVDALRARPTASGLHPDQTT